MGNKKQRSRRHEKDGITDERFAAAASRPQFQKPRMQNSKVVLDERFASVLTDSRFRVEEKDKYGRRTKKQSDVAELNAFYTVADEEKELEQQSEQESSDGENGISVASQDPSENEQAEDPSSRIAYLTALSRGEISVSSSSDDDELSVSADEYAASDAEEASSVVGVLDPSADREKVPLTEVPSPYLAVMNMEWTHVRAVDLFAILSSFAAPASIRRVQIFPSDFGMEQMAKERRFGPSDLWQRRADDEVGNEKLDRNESEVAGSTQESTHQDPNELGVNPIASASQMESDFDPEKLRAYEASKLKYFFAVVEFASPEHADIAYRELDGLELEHSSAAMDLRSIAPDELELVVQGRTLRDEATAVPSTYEPPDFVVNALQQTSVHCTWEDGDPERERKLTGYGSGKGDTTWSALAEEDDLRAYLASDVSSDEEDDSDADEEPVGRGSKMRKLLGLDSENEGDGSSDSDSSVESSFGETQDQFCKEATFVPGRHSLEGKIRSKLRSSSEEPKELTPWQKYQEKRKQKRKERRQLARSNKNGSREEPEDDAMYDRSGVHDENEQNGMSQNFTPNSGSIGDGDDFFLEEQNKSEKVRNKSSSNKSSNTEIREALESGLHAGDRAPSTKEELELLVAGDNDEEATKDYDIRGLLRIDKNKKKKLRGSRKRKEAELAANVSGTDFKVDTKDKRFAAVLDGTDDRFGIDLTDPNFKETPAMREIMSEQTKRRKAKKRALVAPDVSADSGTSFGHTGGGTALSALVQSLKANVAKTGK